MKINEIESREIHLTYSVKEVSKLTSMSKNGIHNEIKSGRLKAVSCGRRTLITPDAIKDWINNMQTK